MLPSTPPPHASIPRGLSDNVYVIDRTGGVGLLGSDAVLEGDTMTVGKRLRRQPMRYAQPQERSRAARASRLLNRLALEMGYQEWADDTLVSGMVAWILANPERRGI